MQAEELYFERDWLSWRAGRYYKIADIGAGVAHELVRFGKAGYGNRSKSSDDSNASNDGAGLTSGSSQAVRTKSNRHGTR